MTKSDRFTVSKTNVAGAPSISKGVIDAIDYKFNQISYQNSSEKSANREKIEYLSTIVAALVESSALGRRFTQDEINEIVSPYNVTVSIKPLKI